MSFNISHTALSDLLQTLKPHHPELPKDARTLLRTKRHSEIKTLSGGEYYYFGVAYWQCRLMERSSSNVTDKLPLHMDIDGIPLFNGSTTCLWPLLGSFNEIEESVFPIAVYCSSHKPDPVSDYLK